MKNLRIIALITAILMIASFVMACTSETEDNDGTTTTTTAKTTTTASKTTTTVEQLPELPDPDPETPITGEDWLAWHESMNTVNGLNPDVDLPTVWPDGAVDNVFDGKDGVINTDEQTKLGGGDANGTVILTFEAPNSTLVAYTLITGNDTGVGDVTGRTPSSWTFYGSNVHPDDATDDDWKVLDDVYDGSMVETPATPFGYSIDEANVGTYNYYKIEFTFGMNDTLRVLQLNEIYLYEAKPAA